MDGLIADGKPISLTDEDVVELVFFPIVKEACRVLGEGITVLWAVPMWMWMLNPIMWRRHTKCLIEFLNNHKCLLDFHISVIMLKLLNLEKKMKIFRYVPC